MTVQILDGNGVLRTVNNLDDFMATNPVGAVAVTASRAVAPAITNDSTKQRITSAASTNITLVSSTARLLRSLDIYNEAAYAVYFKLYDKATAPVIANDTPFWVIPLSSNSGYSKVWPWGVPVTNGIGYVITKVKSDTDATAVAANDLAGLMTFR